MKKTVGINQSNYIPWRGYFDFIRQCDLFVIFDDVQYTSRDWRNRNRIKTPHGTNWLTVPVLHSRNDGTLIMNANINYSTDWIAEHQKWVTISLGKAPFFEEYFDAYSSILEQRFETISLLNIALLKWVNGLLDIRTPMIHSAELEADGKRADRIMDLLRKTEATSYISGPTAKFYLDTETFKRAGIELYFKSYDYEEYPQTHPPYDPAVTILDVLFNTGAEATKRLIQSRTVNEHATAGLINSAE